MGRQNLQNEVIHFIDSVADPATDGHIQRYGDYMKVYVNSAVRRFAYDTDNILWVPADAMRLLGTATAATKGDHVGVLVDAQNEGVAFDFIVPPAFNSITYALLVTIGYATRASIAGWDVTTDFGNILIGDGNTHSDSISSLGTGESFTDWEFATYSIADALTDLAALDNVGVNITQPAPAVNDNNNLITGFLLIWK